MTSAGTPSISEKALALTDQEMLARELERRAEELAELASALEDFEPPEEAVQTSFSIGST